MEMDSGQTEHGWQRELDEAVRFLFEESGKLTGKRRKVLVS